MSLQSVVACRSVKDFSDPVLDLIERTYTESFPEVERRDFSLVRNLVRDESRFIVYALSKEDRYVGFITGWLFDGYTYVEHFAIDPAARNGGIGAEAMKQFLIFCGTPVVLEDNQVYHQPPYREGGEWLEMRLMTYGDVDLEHSFEQVKNCLHKNVYGVKDGLTR